MSAVTIQVSDELAGRLKPFADDLGEIIELGLEAWAARSQGSLPGAAGVLKFLATLPTPEDTMRLQAPDELSTRVVELMDRAKMNEFSDAEQREWEQYQFLEHLVRMAKARALQKLTTS